MKFIVLFGLTLLNIIFAENPFRILGVAPYLKLTKIQKIYKNHLEKLNISDKDEFRRKVERLKKAYDDIKSSRKVEYEEIEDNIVSGLFHLLEQCSISIVLAWLIIVIIFNIISITKNFLRNYYFVVFICIIFYNIYDVFFYYKLHYDSVNMTFFFSIFMMYK